MGSGCSSVGIAVASDARGPRFESRHRQKLILNVLYWKEMKAHINPSFCVYEMPNQFAKDNNQNCLTIGPVAFFYYRAKCTT